MKVIPLAVLLGGSLVSGSVGGAQTSVPAAKTPDLNQLPRLQPSPGDGKPRFKMEIPPSGEFPALHSFAVVESPPPSSTKLDIDPEMVLKPHGFAKQPSRPAAPGKLYPDLKVLPIEIAEVGLTGAPPKPKATPIPRVWPDAKIEPIPTTWKDYRVVPVDSGTESEKH